ncbi:NADH:ubiquinone oxidoreductase subunit 5 (chain L)/Multisubunit Na+/H+ antiporter MnhA subunit (plasmid) [Rubrobacter radiotolerans]|uniref:NADH:ubiquinone oxidoreductase subunit 5 (Chain L)/Multisubunit Na+/H+ antiporter MnhA subunit n=1 Tax=Rubrobacter radiotolerans TaxID=42256 RepID=A0A023X870_RUBRA|nr:proton-conducting transporter membrane subunit [Rubrobacter radiotolerans]AHY48245.1 NADH:ubiquinone oxidoreductase subunit 5 (chain L)/Multisubunit Na+/H+ antiporter MnhA subunit [Rubrobacter radiotolerans]MDX5895277.1 proton-conducting transporter membrane subunit [Rubrobacter radiotolerans]SMC01958.1 multicomponent Na+:H+ antiporter subunit D [Rubrobacter radiotolerans DSM 5868]
MVGEVLAQGLPLLVVLISAFASGIIFFLGERRSRLRTSLYLGAQVVKLLLVFGMLWGIYVGEEYEVRYLLVPGTEVVPEIEFLLRGGELAMLFLVLSSGLWLITTVYSIGYLRDDPHRSRFFGFFGLCVTSTVGIALAGNLFTFFIFYELLTLTTYPLVVHRDTPEAMVAGRKYLAYTLCGGVALLVGMVALQVIAGPVEFTPGGVLTGEEASPAGLVAIFALLIAGLGVKNAFVPLHGWLPAAMIAPTPVSALLHGVAVVKAGAFGIVRVVYEVYGVGLATELGVGLPVAILASVTIVYGSLKAMFQDELKKRLAYSTVSQVSYIVLGASLLSYPDTVGGVAHLVHQGLMKVTLFLCAGIVAETVGIKHVSKMGGVGRRLPWTMGAFTVAALGMIGLPPMAGFISKWYLGVGAMQAGQSWAIGVLVASTVLNAVYFLPILYNSFFGKPPDGSLQEGRQEKRPGTRFETDWLMLFPTLALAALIPLVGILAGLDVSPLGWARLIADREWAGELP